MGKESDADYPFDLYGDLEDAYDEAEQDADIKRMETLDLVHIWEDRQRGGSAFLYTLWRAIVLNDPESQDEVGEALVLSKNGIRGRDGCEWMNGPHLAQYWYGLAADAGRANSQNCLGRLYCPDCAPKDAFKLGRFARDYWKSAAEQKFPGGMHNLARCLRCGKCPCCNVDVKLAAALDAEAYCLENEAKGI